MVYTCISNWLINSLQELNAESSPCHRRATGRTISIRSVPIRTEVSRAAEARLSTICECLLRCSEGARVVLSARGDACGRTDETHWTFHVCDSAAHAGVFFFVFIWSPVTFSKRGTHIMWCFVISFLLAFIHTPCMYTTPLHFFLYKHMFASRYGLST